MNFFPQRIWDVSIARIHDATNKKCLWLCVRRELLFSVAATVTHFSIDKEPVVYPRQFMKVESLKCWHSILVSFLFVKQSLIEYVSFTSVSLPSRSLYLIMRCLISNLLFESIVLLLDIFVSVHLPKLVLQPTSLYADCHRSFSVRCGISLWLSIRTLLGAAKIYTQVVHCDMLLVFLECRRVNLATTLIGVVLCVTSNVTPLYLFSFRLWAGAFNHYHTDASEFSYDVVTCILLCVFILTMIATELCTTGASAAFACQWRFKSQVVCILMGTLSARAQIFVFAGNH